MDKNSIPINFTTVFLTTSAVGAVGYVSYRLGHYHCEKKYKSVVEDLTVRVKKLKAKFA